MNSDMPPEPDKIVYAGAEGGKVSYPSPWRSLIPTVIGAMVITVVLVVGVLTRDTWLPLIRGNAPAVSTHSQTINGQPEPDSTARFMAALRAHDPVGMQAEITAQCIADKDSNLCFGPTINDRFKTAMKDKVIVYRFLGVYSITGFKVAVYTLEVVGGGHYTFNLTLDPAGKIVRAVLVGVDPITGGTV